MKLRHGASSWICVRNEGGNSRVIGPLVAGLSARRKVIGQPIVLIGPYTLSSGVIAARDLREKTKAVLMGTLTGGLLGGYGNAPTRKLPHFPITMQWTINYFTWPAEPVTPDVKVPIMLSGLLFGRDPVLNAAIATPR